MFSNNIKNINNTQKIRNTSKEKYSHFYKMIHSTCYIGTSRTKMKNILKTDSHYKTLENQTKSKICNSYKKKCSTQERFKTKIPTNNNILNKKVSSLK